MFQIFIHGSNLEDVYKVLPCEMMPTEYQPDDFDGPSAGTIKELSGLKASNSYLKSVFTRRQVIYFYEPFQTIALCLRCFICMVSTAIYS